MRLSSNDFTKLVREALKGIPPRFARYLEDVAVDVEPMPDRQTCEELGLEDPTELFGLYQGTPLTERSVEQPIELPDRIILYQRNIESVCDCREDVIEEVRTTVLHEIGHHFGLDENDLEELGYD